MRTNVGFGAFVVAGIAIVLSFLVAEDRNASGLWASAGYLVALGGVVEIGSALRESRQPSE